MEGVTESICYLIIYFVAKYGSIPQFLTSIPSGFDSVMHFSKIRIFLQYFPLIPRWFPWWYCGTPSLRFYPPLSYLTATTVGWLFKTSTIRAYQFTDFFSFFLAGLFTYLFMKALGCGRISSVSSAVLYLIIPQTLYGRFFIGHFTHNFSMFLIPLMLFCIVKYGDNMRRTVLIATPLFMMLFLSHFQTALSLGFMLAIIIFFILIVRLWKNGSERIRTINSISGLFVGGVLGAFLASFWLLPSLLEGSGRLGLTSKAALGVMIPVESLFVPADQLWYLSDIQKIWCRQYFLGFPLIFLSFLAIALIIKRKLVAKKMLWGIIFTSWSVFFLFAIVSPYIGLFLGWPNRVPYFISISMAMLAGLAVDWVERHILFASLNSVFLKRLALYLLLTAVILSSLIHSYNVEQFVYNPYSNENQVSEWLKSQNLKPDERIASFGTISYVFNVVSNGWQVDGGYTQGQINPDFNYKCWLTLTETDDINAILQILNETNTRYVVIPKGSGIPTAYQNQSFFDRTEINGFNIFRLKENYTLNFVTVTNGEASVNYSYPHPDKLHLIVQNCSENVTLLVKMNYYQGWTADSSQGEVSLTKNSDGLMKIDVNGAESLDITLQYGPTLIDHIALGVTITGAVIYLFLFLSGVWKFPKWDSYLSQRIRHRIYEKIEKKAAWESPRRSGEYRQAPIIQPERKKKRRIKWFYHFIAIIIVSVYALYISWPYVSSVGVPAFVDAPGHAFKVWNLIDCWSKYKVIPYLWDSWWYEGYPFLQVYPPLSYMIAAFSGGVFLGGDPIAGFRLTIVLSNILAAVFMYVGIHTLFKSRMGGIVGGIVYASSAYSGAAVRTGMLPFYVAVMFLPLTIALYQRYLSSSSLRRIVFLASGMALLLLTHIQLFVYAFFTLALYSILMPGLKFHREKITDFLGKFVKNVKALVLTVLIALCFTSFWLIPFLTYRGLFYTGYPEYYRTLSSIKSLLLFFQQSKCYLGLATIGLIILAFILIKRTRRNRFMIFFLIVGLLSSFLSVYQIDIFKGTIVEQLPLYSMITPDRWVFITFLSLAFLAGGATKFICDLHRFKFLSQRTRARHVSKALITLIIVIIIVLDVSSHARNFYVVPVVQSFPASIEKLSNEDGYYRVYTGITGMAYVPAVSNREILTGWYAEGSVLRDWLYNLDWMTSYGERENMIPPLLELFAVKYYVVSADDLNRIERFNKTGEFNISYEEDWCVMELKRDAQYLSAKHSILYLGKEEDLTSIAEALLFSSNSSILVHGWKEYVDDYTVEELSQFDAVLLYRHNYRDQARMEELLLQYANGGGIVLLAPFYSYPILCMELYYAESEGKTKINVNESFRDTIFRDVNVTRFSPASYAGQYPWRYVAFNVTSTQQETETILTIDDNPVLAMSTVGKGKIVWVGFNFLGHINQFLNKDEGKMIGNLLSWACGRNPHLETTMLEKRPYGYADAVFKVDKKCTFWLLISETYYPGWRIYMNQKPAKIYMAEPKLMIVKVDANANTDVHISLRYEPTEAHVLGCTITVLSVFLAGIMLFRPALVRNVKLKMRKLANARAKI
jgi:uncharacterized membrane protein